MLTSSVAILDRSLPTLPKSSSWKSKLTERATKIFAPSISSCTGLPQSSYSGSLKSVGTTKISGSCSTAGLRFPSAHHSDNQSAHASLTPSIEDPLCPATPAYRYVDNSFAANHTAAFESSFVPRQSFEGNSIALSDVPIWPPPVGVILLSPRESPPKNEDVRSGAKRRLGIEDEYEVEENFPDDGLSTYFNTIRVLPRSVPDSSALLSPIRSPGTADRRIACIPKRYNELASKPPQFNIKPPALPSLASVMIKGGMDTLAKAEEEILPIPGSFETSDGKPTPEMAKEDIEEVSSPYPMFVFGSPAQKPITNDSFTKAMTKAGVLAPPALRFAQQASRNPAIDGPVIENVWTQMRERLEMGEGGLQALSAKQSARLGMQLTSGADPARPNPRKGSGAMRFEDVHDRGFAK